jgi:hypothetical protein
VPLNQNNAFSHCRPQSARTNLMKFFWRSNYFWISAEESHYFLCTNSTPITIRPIPARRTGLNGTLSSPNQPKVSER